MAKQGLFKKNYSGVIAGTGRASMPAAQQPVLNTEGMRTNMQFTTPKGDTEFIAPKGMSFRDAFRQARMEGRTKFQWFDPKMGEYRPIAVELAGDQTPTNNKPVNSAAPVTAAPVQVPAAAKAPAAAPSKPVTSSKGTTPSKATVKPTKNVFVGRPSSGLITEASDNKTYLGGTLKGPEIIASRLPHPLAPNANATQDKKPTAKVYKKKYNTRLSQGGSWTQRGNPMGLKSVK